MKLTQKSVPTKIIEVLPDKIVGLEALQAQGHVHRKQPVSIRCHARMVSTFALVLKGIALSQDWQLAQLTFIQQTQKQHGVDLRQCYWDWLCDENGATVFVVGKAELDRAISRLPAHCQVTSVIPSSEMLSSQENSALKNINLWPWREMQWANARRHWYRGLISIVVVALLVTILGHWLLSSTLHDKMPNSQSIQHDYATKIKMLKTNIAEIEGMVAQRGQLAYWMRWLASHLPKKSVLQQWYWQNRHLTLSFASILPTTMQALAKKIDAVPNVRRYIIDGKTLRIELKEPSS